MRIRSPSAGRKPFSLTTALRGSQQSRLPLNRRWRTFFCSELAGQQSDSGITTSSWQRVPSTVQRIGITTQSFHTRLTTPNSPVFMLAAAKPFRMPEPEDWPSSGWLIWISLRFIQLSVYYPPRCENHIYIYIGYGCVRQIYNISHKDRIRRFDKLRLFL